MMDKDHNLIGFYLEQFATVKTNKYKLDVYNNLYEKVHKYVLIINSIKIGAIQNIKREFPEDNNYSDWKIEIKVPIKLNIEELKLLYKVIDYYKSLEIVDKNYDYYGIWTKEELINKFNDIQTTIRENIASIVLNSN